MEAFITKYVQGKKSIYNCHPRYSCLFFHYFVGKSVKKTFFIRGRTVKEKITFFTLKNTTAIELEWKGA